jgi:WS/DGAT/MGAT family acyltransferase
VVDRFRPGDKQAARVELGLPADRFVVLVSCGAYAFGDTDATVTALLRASPEVQVVAACGRNAETQRRLQALGEPEERLLAMGWTDQMPRYVQAADVVLSNAGGATALEALATGRPLLMSQPIAAHGKANADLMVVAGLAELCSSTEALESYVRAAVRDRPAPGEGRPTVVQRITDRARAHREDHDLASALRGLTTRDPDSGRWPMRPQDAFFSHVEQGPVLQEIGAVLELEDVEPGVQLSRDALHEAVTASLAGLVPLRSRVVQRGRLWWRPDEVDLERHISVVHVTGGPEAAQEAIDRFWSTPLPRDRPAWQAHLVRTDGSSPSLLTLRMHHVYGDGISALGLFDRVLTPAPDDPLRERASSALSRASGPLAQARRVGQQAALTARGLASLATRGSPPAHGLNRPIRGSGRRLTMVTVPRVQLRELSRRYRAHNHEVVLSVVAESLGRLLDEAGLATAGEPLRVMVPVAMRPPRLDRVFGNWTGSVALDLPTGAMSFADRVAEVRDELRRRVRRGEPQGAEVVMRLAGQLPVAAHRWFARTVYTKRFFNSIVSYMPAARGPRWIGGARVRTMFPVLPLATDVPLTVGVILADQTAGLGILTADDVPLTHDQIRAAVLRAVDDASNHP